MSEPNDNGEFARTNVAVWVLTTVSGAFLFVRLWCRHHFSQLWWDDCVLTISWVLMLVAGALVSRTITVGSATDDARRAFFVYHDTSTWMTTVATSWAKVAFAITLTRIVRERFQTYFLWTIIVTANLILIPGTLSIWIPACGDPRGGYRPEHTLCFKLKILQYLGGTTMVYGGVVDVLLALFPWFVLRNLLLETREKVGLTVAMSLGAFTGVIVILRSFYQLVQGDYDYVFMVYMALFNFLEPSVTIIAQTIPMFRVLFVNVKRSTQKASAVRLNSPTSRVELVVPKSKSNSMDNRPWDGNSNGQAEHDHEFVNERFYEGKVYDGKPYDGKPFDGKVYDGKPYDGKA